MIESIAVILNKTEVQKAEDQGYEIEEVLGYTRAWFNIDDVARALVVMRDDIAPDSEIQVDFYDDTTLFFRYSSELVAALDRKFG